MEEFDEMLRRMAEKEECTVPKGFDERLQETLDGLPSRRKKRRGLGVLKGAAVAAAACALLMGTALAVSPGLREALTAALGGFAPYAQEQEDKTYIIDGLEFKVKSVLADDFTIRAYVEVRDPEGDIFDKIDDLTIPTRVSGGVDVPFVHEWLAPDATESWMSGAECLSYDAESRTALLVVSTWKAMPEDMTVAAVQVRAMNSYLTGDYEEVWRNRWGRAIPVEVKPVDTTVLGRDTALVSGLDAEEARLSPLGLTLIFPDYEIRRPILEGAALNGTDAAHVSVKLADGSTVEALWGGHCGIFLPPYDENSSRVIIMNFREPVETEQVQGIYVGEDYYPVEGPAAVK